MLRNSRILLAEIRNVTEPLGFQSTKNNVFVRHCSQGFSHRIVVPMDVPENHLSFSCTVNLMLTRTGNVHGNRLCVNIGAITPRRRWHYWQFPFSDPPNQLIRQITLGIQTYAEPWFQSFQSVEDMIHAVHQETYTSRRTPLINSFEQFDREEPERIDTFASNQHRGNTLHPSVRAMNSNNAVSVF